MIIERATVADAGQILALQKLAYVSEAELYGNYAIEPLVQSVEDIRRQFTDHVFLKAVADGAIVGSVRGCLKQGTCYIGKLIVHPDYQNRGIGKMLMAALEEVFPAPLRCELFTGHKSAKNLRLYEKLGYTSFRTEPIAAGVSLVFLEKRLD